MRNLRTDRCQRIDIFEHLLDPQFRRCRNSSADGIDGGTLGILADVGIETVDDGRIRAEDRNDYGFRDTGFGTETGKTVTEAMKAVDRGLSFTSRGCHGRFQPDPFDHPQDINIDQAVANFLASFIHDLIAGGDLGQT